MKATTTLLTGLIILAAGIIMLIAHNDIKSGGIVTTAGILFLISGIINTVLYLSAKNEDGRRRNRGASRFFGTVVSIASIVLGLSMFIFNSTFIKLIPLVFAVLLLFGAIIQFYILAVGTRPVVMPKWTYVFPVIILIEAIVVFTANLSDDRMMLVTGSGLAIFGIAGFVEAFLLSAGNRHLRNQAREQQNFMTQMMTTKTPETKEIKSLDD